MARLGYWDNREITSYRGALQVVVNVKRVPRGLHKDELKYKARKLTEQDGAIYRAVKSTKVRKGMAKDTSEVATLNEGTVVIVVELQNRRVRITHPVEGWCSLYKNDGRAFLVNERPDIREGNIARHLDGRIGAIRYIGRLMGEQEFIGLEFDSPRGKNDGSVNGKRYFTTEPKHGLFVKANKLADCWAPDACEDVRLRWKEGDKLHVYDDDADVG